jgi:hypothetical protein
MTTNTPFLLRFATPFNRVREFGGPEGNGTSSTDPTPAAASSLNDRGESRFTRVRNETTDDD